MALHISENLKRLRHSRELTQEKFAEIIGVSSQSVSKWECGDNFPDIALLPAIANFFEITVDELLGMNEISGEARIAEAHAKTAELRKPKTQHNEIIKLWSELARDMPNNWTVQMYYAYYFSDYGNGGVDKGTRELNLAHKREVIPVYERILDNCTDDDIRGKTLALLANVYAELHEFDKAHEIANRLPTAIVCREYLNEQIAIQEINKFIAEGKFENKEALKSADREAVEKLIAPFERGFEAFMQRTNNSLINIQSNRDRFGLVSAEENLRQAELLNALVTVAHMDCPELLDPRGHYMNMTAAYCRLGEIDNALDYLEKYIDEEIIRVPWSQMANHITWETNEFGNSVPKILLEPERKLVKGMFELHPEYAALLDQPRYIAAMEKLYEGEPE
jgi:transcriptional regulator with XRE-family HTH domain